MQCGAVFHAVAGVHVRAALRKSADNVCVTVAGLGDPFEALGDPNRRAIVELLGSGGKSVGEVADALPISRPAVSRHLRLLKEAGLVVTAPGINNANWL